MKKIFKDKQILKLFIYMVSMRRNFHPIVSVYFLMLPNTTANQIGIFMGIGFILQLLLEVPSGYISDLFGHKKTLIVSKVSAIVSVLFYILGGTVFSEHAFIFFTIAAALQSLMFTLNSGTLTAFFHNMLVSQGKEKKFTKKLSKLRANVSLVSIFFIILLPFFTEISLFFPFVIAGIIDIIGLFAIITIPDIKNKEEEKKEKEQKSIKQLFQEAVKLGFIPMGMFGSFVVGVTMGSSAFRSVYMTDIGLPLVLIGSVMALSRFFWFIIGHFVHIIEEKFTMKQHFFTEIFIFSGMYFIVVLFPNMYVVGFFFALVGGYQWARSGLISKYVLDRYSPDKRYKATILSIQSQFSSIAAIVVSFGIGYVMSESLRLGFLVLGFVSIVGLSVSFYYIFRKK